MDFLGRQLRGMPRLRLAQGAAPRRPASASCASRSQAKAPGSRSRSRRAIGAATANGAGCARNRSRAGAPDGEHVGFIGVAHDITAAKQAETELRRLNETLEAAGRGAHARARPHLERVAGPPGGRRSERRLAQRQSGRDGAARAGARPSWSAGPRNGIEHPDDIARTRAELGASGRRSASPSGSRTACATRTAPIAGCPGRPSRTRA